MIPCNKCKKVIDNEPCITQAVCLEYFTGESFEVRKSYVDKIYHVDCAPHELLKHLCEVVMVDE